MILPDLQELVALRSAAHGLSLGAKRAALAQLQGGHRSVQRGRGLEFEEVRPYAEGDDRRSIDWRVTARRGRPYTKVFREDRERPVWLLADLHPGLYFGSKRQLKSALLLRAGAFFGWVACLSGDRFGAIIAQGKSRPQIFPPRSRHAGVLTVLQALVDAQPRAPGTPDLHSLNALLATLRPLIRPGSLVLLLSDFSGLDTDTEVLLSGVAARSDCRLLAISDPLESNGLPAGDYEVGLPGRSWWLNGLQIQPAWHRTWAEREQRISNLAQGFNLPLTHLQTPDAIMDVLPPLIRQPAWAA